MKSKVGFYVVRRHMKDHSEEVVEVYSSYHRAKYRKEVLTEMYPKCNVWVIDAEDYLEIQT